MRFKTRRFVVVIAGMLAAVALLGGAALAVNEVTNGSFEDGLTGWTAGGGGVDVVGFWEASDGVLSVDLNAFTPGSVSQTFPTTAGTEYAVTFDMAGNSFGCGPISPIKTMVVSATGGVPAGHSFDTTGTTAADMGWEPRSYSFVAVGPSSTLSFVSTTGSAGGPVLDNVVVTGASLPTPESKGDCKKGGWQSLFDHEGNGFKNQGDCVSYVATGGSNLGSVTP